MSWLCKPCTSKVNNQLKAEKRRIEREKRLALPPETLKACRRCGELKSIADDFHRRRKESEGRVAVCKACHSEKLQDYFADPVNRARRFAAQKQYHELSRPRTRARSLQKYGITPGEYDRMYDEQDGLCAICLSQRSRLGTGASRGDVLCVDHDHESGRVRGLLCQRCNRAIGLLGDDHDVLLSAIDYLQRIEEVSHGR